MRMVHKIHVLMALHGCLKNGAKICNFIFLSKREMNKFPSDIMLPIEVSVASSLAIFYLRDHVLGGNSRKFARRVS